MFEVETRIELLMKVDSQIENQRGISAAPRTLIRIPHVRL